ncbi:MAG: FtsX-like permease family protein [Phycisphaerales bacterium]|nr:MAG: FtsX-like permease family protein [Phycisphaerales bacterium]
MYKIILAIRYLIRCRITYFAVLAVALCVWIVVIVMTVMTGLVGGYKLKNHKFVGDCVVGTKSLVGFAYYEDFIKMLEDTDYVEGVSPVIKSYALAGQPGTGQDIRLEMIGVDPARHSQATGFAETLHYHVDDVSKVFEPREDGGLSGCVIGIDRILERDSNGRYTAGPYPADIEVAVSCFPLTSRGALVKATTGLVNTKTFYYSDHSRTGLARVDSSVIYLPFEQAQLLCGMGGVPKRVNAIHIKFKPGVRLQEGCQDVSSLWRMFKQAKTDESQSYLLDAVTVQSWRVHRRMFIAAMEKEQAMLTVMFGFVGITTVFIVFVVFYMIVSHKRKDIGILKSVGVSNANIVQLFSGFAFLIGVLGSSIGTVAGWLFLLKINRIETFLFERFGFQLWDRVIFFIGDIPNEVEFKVLAVIVLSAIGACLLGALVPSLQAASLRPAETLQVGQL